MRFRFAPLAASLVALLALAGCRPSGTGGSGSGTPAAHRKLADAFAVARRENRPVMISFGGPW